MAQKRKKSPCCDKTVYLQLAIPGTRSEYEYCGACGKKIKK